jgi:hypothetical protein
MEVSLGIDMIFDSARLDDIKKIGLRFERFRSREDRRYRKGR